MAFSTCGQLVYEIALHVTLAITPTVSEWYTHQASVFLTHTLSPYGPFPLMIQDSRGCERDIKRIPTTRGKLRLCKTCMPWQDLQTSRV